MACLKMEDGVGRLLYSFVRYCVCGKFPSYSEVGATIFKIKSRLQELRPEVDRRLMLLGAALKLESRCIEEARSWVYCTLSQSGWIVTLEGTYDTEDTAFSATGLSTSCTLQDFMREQVEISTGFFLSRPSMTREGPRSSPKTLLQQKYQKRS